MSTYTKVVLSGSTQGKGIKIGQTTSPGTTIHTAISGTTSMDEIWLFAVNSTSASKKLTIEWGTEDAPDGNIEQTISAESGLVLIVPGLLLQNSLVIKAFCETTNVVMVHGYCNRIT